MYRKIFCMILAVVMLFSYTTFAQTESDCLSLATELFSQYPEEGLSKDNLDYFLSLKEVVVQAEESGVDLSGISNFDKFQLIRWQLAEVISAEATAVNENAYIMVRLDEKIPAEKINQETIAAMLDISQSTVSNVLRKK